MTVCDADWGGGGGGYSAKIAVHSEVNCMAYAVNSFSEKKIVSVGQTLRDHTQAM